MSSSWGKWSAPGVPHKDWMCVGIEDLKRPAAICEMCERQEIRYVHHMSHPGYPEELGVGCVCASRMERDSQAAAHRERRLRNVAKRRRRWLKREWRTSTKGNSYLNTDGLNIVVFRYGGRWAARLTNRATTKSLVLKRRFDSEDEAKLGAFDALMELLDLRETAS